MTKEQHLWNKSLAEFSRELAQCPTPGCGAAAAVTASLGLALIQKGLVISAGDEPAAKVSALVQQLSDCSSRLSGFAEEDAAAFSAYLRSRQDRAVEADTEKDEGQGELLDSEQAPAILINEVPLSAAAVCLDGLDIVEPALSLTSANLRSDVLAGAQLLHSGLLILLRVVGSNLSVLDDASQRRLARRRQVLQSSADRILNSLTTPDQVNPGD